MVVRAETKGVKMTPKTVREMNITGKLVNPNMEQSACDVYIYMEDK